MRDYGEGEFVSNPRNSYSLIDWMSQPSHFLFRLTCIMLINCREGYIAIVHDADLSYKNQIDKYGIPAEVDENETLNWFKVKWNGDFPGSSPENSCEANKCKARSDGSCVCRTSVSESAVFDSIENVDRDQIMSELFIGATGPCLLYTSDAADE